MFVFTLFYIQINIQKGTSSFICLSIEDGFLVAQPVLSLNLQISDWLFMSSLYQGPDVTIEKKLTIIIVESNP